MSWACETDAETMLLSEDAPGGALFPDDLEAAEALCRSVSCPVLVVTSELDACQPPDRGARVAELTGGRLVELKGAGHIPNARHPVLVNLLIKEFVDGIHPPASVRRMVSVGPSSGKRVLFLSSPIGLGHARRDLAVADALRELRPEVTVDWMTQHPVTAALEARGERVHPACDWLANESQHVESEAGEHDVHVFQALRVDGRDPRRELHGVPRRARVRAVRPGRRRRGVGRRPLPARASAAEARSVRVDDRLRRLPADARRGRARGVPDGRLQRGDDRARRGTSARARPFDLRRRSGRHRPGRLRFGPPDRSASGPKPTTTSRATSPATTRPRRPTGRRSAPSSATGPTNASAS